MDRHHLLDLFEKLHETYKLKEQDYKTFVEALGGKKEPLDVTGAKIVLVNFDQIDEVFDEELDEPYFHCIQNCKKILKVIPSENPIPADWPTYGAESSDHNAQYLNCMTHLREYEILEPVLQKFAELIASGRAYIQYDHMNVYRFNSIEVLHRE